MFLKILSQAVSSGRNSPLNQVWVVKVLILLPGSLSGPDSEVPDNGIKQIPETGGAGPVTSDQ